MLRQIGPLELVIILAIVILIFGVGRVGKIGRELGSAISEFRRGLKSDDTANASETEAETENKN